MSETASKMTYPRVWVSQNVLWFQKSAHDPILFAEMCAYATIYKSANSSVQLGFDVMKQRSPFFENGKTSGGLDDLDDLPI